MLGILIPFFGLLWLTTVFQFQLTCALISLQVTLRASSNHPYVCPKMISTVAGNKTWSSENVLSGGDSAILHEKLGNSKMVSFTRSLLVQPIYAVIYWYCNLCFYWRLSLALQAKFGSHSSISNSKVPNMHGKNTTSTWSPYVTNTTGEHGDGADAGSIVYADNDDSIRLANVLIKMQSQLGKGMPELGLVLSPTQPRNNLSNERDSVNGKNKENQDKLESMCRIKSINKGSPAHQTGCFREGDVIRRINMTDVTKLNTEEVVSLLRRAVIDSKWTYSPIRLQVARASTDFPGIADVYNEDGQIDLLSLMDIAIKKNSKMVASKKPNPIRKTLLQRSLCDHLDRALSARGYYDVTYNI